MQAPQNVVKVPAQMIRRYQQTKNDYKQIVKTITNLEDIKKENLIVLNQIDKLEANRRCFRLIGGVLVERTIEEAIKGIKDNVENRLSPSLKTLKEKMELKEKQLIEYEKNIGYQRKQNAIQKEKEIALEAQKKQQDKNIGLLA